MSDLQLINAVKEGDSATARTVIASGADVNQQDEQGWTPLNWAAGKGDIELVRLLVEHGADMFKVGRDQRTPYMIALAAGRVEVAKFLREAEDHYAGQKPAQPPRSYCRAYYLGDLRRYPGWSESKINWKESKPGRQDEDASPSGEDAQDEIVFIHEDLTVTRSMWRDENVIFNQTTPEWQAFCENVLNFKVPDDLDYIPAADPGH